MKFSPDSKFLAIASERHLRIFESPGTTKTFSPLLQYKRFGNLHTEDIINVNWSHDSRFLLTTSHDMTVKMVSLHKLPNFLPFTFSGNKNEIVNAFFSEGEKRIFSVSRDGGLLLWKWVEERSESYQNHLKFEQYKLGKRVKTTEEEEEILKEDDFEHLSEFEKVASQGRFVLEKRQKLQLTNKAKIICAEYNSQSKILVLGFTNGQFSVYNLDTLKEIHSF